MHTPEQAREDAKAGLAVSSDIRWRAERDERAGYCAIALREHEKASVVGRLVAYAEEYARLTEGIATEISVRTQQVEHLYPEDAEALGGQRQHRAVPFLNSVIERLTALLAEGQPDEGGAR